VNAIAGNAGWRAMAAHVGTTRGELLGDDLYCNQPFCEQVLEQGLNFVFTCKPDSHVRALSRS